MDTYPRCPWQKQTSGTACYVVQQDRGAFLDIISIHATEAGAKSRLRDIARLLKEEFESVTFAEQAGGEELDPENLSVSYVEWETIGSVNGAIWITKEVIQQP